MNKTAQIDGFAGIRNNVTAERLAKNDMAAAVNVDLDRTGKPARRAGWVRVRPGASHSLWSDGDDAFFVAGNTLRRLAPDLTASTVLAGVTGPRVRYVRIAGDVYWTDGLQSGIVGQEGYRPWGIAVPSAPSLAVATGGLRAGVYLAAITFVRSTGLESGSSRILTLEVPANSGLAFTNIPVSADPLVTEKRLYVSAPGGELPYLTATLTNSNTSVTISALPNAQGMPLATRFMGPPPAGQVIGEWSGYSFVASGAYLWYSRPYQYELFSLRDGYIAMGGPVQIFAPVSNGLYVATLSETVFLSGNDPAKFERNVVAPYGAVRGTELEVRNDLVSDKGVKGTAVMWASPAGICLGLDGGEFKNLTSARYTLPVAPTSGASLFKVRNGTPQFLTTLDA